MDTRTESLTEVERLEQAMPSSAGEGGRVLRSFEDRAGQPAVLAAACGYARPVDGALRKGQRHGNAPDAPER